MILVTIYATFGFETNTLFSGHPKTIAHTKWPLVVAQTGIKNEGTRMSRSTSQISIAEIKSANQELLLAERSRSAGDLDHAQNLLEQLLSRYPDYFSALSTLGMVHMQRQAYRAAFPHLARAAMLNPDDWITLTNLGKVYLELDAPERAIHYLEKSLELDSSQHSTLFIIGTALISKKQYSRAAEILERICAAGPEIPAAPLWLSHCYLQLQRYDEAAKILKQAMESPLDRDLLSFGCILANELPKDAKLDLVILETLDQLGGHQANDAEETKLNIIFSRAACLERHGKHKEAWQCLSEVNAELAEQNTERRKIYWKQAEDLLETSLSWMPSQDSSPEDTGDSPTLLFILGPSRSGKTTLENLAAELPGVIKSYENDIVIAAAKRVSQMADLLTTEYICKLPREFDSDVSKTIQMLLQDAAKSTDFITVTHPGVIHDVGRLTDCVSNVRFAFVKRNEDDNAFRIFGHFYKLNTNEYAHSTSEIYSYLNQYNQLIDHWLETLGDKTILINYEEMIDNPHATLERVAQFCGVDMPADPVLQTGDDRSCSAPYLEWLHAAKAIQN